MNQKLTQAPITAVSLNRAQRRKAAKRNHKAQLIKAALCFTIALTAGVAFSGYGKPDTEIAFVTDPPSANIVTLENQYTDYIVPPTTHIQEATGPAPLLASIPLDDETQRTIYEMCGEDPTLFCTVMAIAQKETRFNPEAVGDSGESIGMMQIHTYWQRDRIDRLGITDLTDPAQNAEVAIDFLWWIAYRLAPEHPDSVLGTGAIFMAYNCGLQGAYDSWEQGITETSYSRDCTAYFEAFMAELEVGA